MPSKSSRTNLTAIIGPFTALHGRVGVVRNQHLITSPNAAWVPSIQWQNCQVSLCQDMRFGIDDYVLWPQWYQEKFPYLPAIPRPPTRGEESPFWRMWYSPCKGDFSATEGSADGKRPGYIHKGFAEELEALRAGLSDEVEHILSGLLAAQDHTNTAASFGAALARVRHAWVILSSWAGTFDEKRLEFAEWQRAWLELKGMCNYQRWNADRVLNPTHAPRAFVENCIGCVTDKPLIALSFFEMGIPVWLVRDKMSVLLGDTFIERPSTQVIRPGDHGEVICLQRDPTFPIIYGESPQLLAHYHVQQQFSRIRAVIHRVSPTGTVVHKGIPHAMMTRQDAKSVLISLRDMRAQPATETKRIANAPFSSTVSTPSAYAASSSHTPALSGRRDRRMRPCKYPASLPSMHVLTFTQMARGSQPHRSLGGLTSALRRPTILSTPCSSKRMGRASRTSLRNGGMRWPESTAPALREKRKHRFIFIHFRRPGTSPDPTRNVPPSSSRVGFIFATTG